MKRVLDIMCSSLGLLFLLPFILIIAIAIRLDSTGPVYFRGERIGRGGLPFRIFKFRSMVQDALSRGPRITAENDLRLTRVGRVLRELKLDELPQLINVLSGDMSLVGPRPEDPRYVGYFTLEQRKILDFRPGITSPASIAFRHESSLLTGKDWEKNYLERIMPKKLAIDLEYFQRATVWSDIGVIARTIQTLVLRKEDLDGFVLPGR